MPLVSLASGRARQQVILGTGSQANFRASKSEINAKLVIYDGVGVEELQALGLADQQMRVSNGLGWHDSFMDIAIFAGLALGNEDARKILPFNGFANLQVINLESLKAEINELIVGNHEAAKAKVRSDQPARAKQSEISKAKSKAGPSTVRLQWSEEDWNKWNYGGYHGRT